MTYYESRAVLLTNEVEIDELVEVTHQCDGYCNCYEKEAEKSFASSTHEAFA